MSNETLYMEISILLSLLYKKEAECDGFDVPITRDVDYRIMEGKCIITKESAYRNDGQWCKLWTLVNAHELAPNIVNAPISINNKSIKADGLYTYGSAINPIRYKHAMEVQGALRQYSRVMEHITSRLPYATATLFQFGNTEVKLSSQRFIHCRGHGSAVELFHELIDLVEYIVNE